uniref:Uncharacterized protein n=1 Tax=Candidozyma auris TaxID=498019 RepID=A0A0L0NVY8_CANAR
MPLIVEVYIECVGKRQKKLLGVVILVKPMAHFCVERLERPRAIVDKRHERAEDGVLKVKTPKRIVDFLV